MHIPVLKKKVLEILDPKPDDNFVDCTVGEAGHTLAILEKNGPKGKVLGIERDAQILKNTKYKIQNTEYKDRIILVCDNFVNLKKIVKENDFRKISGILFDLGMSSWHLEESGKGFSFQRDEPLDMRYSSESQMTESKCQKLTAAEIVNEWKESEIEKILREYGQERFAKIIARAIFESRKIKPIKTTFQLVEIIRKAVPKNYERRRIHPATRTFQALRIAVNNELNNLEKALFQAVEILNPEGRLIVVSFHSLEDRILKRFLKEKEKEKILKIITKKPIKPSLEEIKMNRRSRSAKLRAAQKLINHWH